MDCPQCGAEMERGTLRVDAGSVVGTRLRWVLPNDAGGMWGTAGETVEPVKSALIDLDLPGFRCLNCKLLVVSYEGDQNQGERA
jgi:hypothetical protein